MMHMVIVVLSTVVLLVVSYIVGDMSGVLKERAHWQAKERFLDSSGCVWLKGPKDSSKWIPDHCQFPIPEAVIGK